MKEERNSNPKVMRAKHIECNACRPSRTEPEFPPDSIYSLKYISFPSSLFFSLPSRASLCLLPMQLLSMFCSLFMLVLECFVHGQVRTAVVRRSTAVRRGVTGNGGYTRRVSRIDNLVLIIIRKNRPSTSRKTPVQFQSLVKNDPCPR